MADQRQTISYLIRRFREVGLRPDTRHGQNFLIDLNLLRMLADSAELTGNDVALEIGTGTGSLTALLARRAAAVVTVEIDVNIQQLAREELADVPNVVMLQQDALKNKNAFAPEVISAVQEQLDARPGSQFKLAANLPYNIATPVLANLLVREPVPALMTATIQKELADRITARPSTKDYSALSIWMQSLCHCEVLRELPPTVFWPRPKVQSAIVQCRPDPQLRARIPDLGFFHTFVRSLFFHRRKFLRSVVRSAMKGQLDKDQIDPVLSGMGLGPDARAEQLDVETILALCEGLRALL